MSIENCSIDFPDGIRPSTPSSCAAGWTPSHLIAHGGPRAFVDTGTNFSVPTLLQGDRSPGSQAESIDFVLLTHVHLDHCRRRGTPDAALPNARAVIHPRGARHMIDPAKLIAGGQAGLR